MLKKERQNKILLILNKKGKVLVNKLAVELNVSEDTIRRDITEMDKNKLLKKVFGGALPINTYVLNYSERENYEPELKYKLALKAVSLIKEGQLIAIDGGTTNFQIAKALPVDLNITVITNSLAISTELCNHKNVKVIVIGGNLFTKIISNVGEMAVNQVKEYYPDIFFLGAYAIHPVNGITSPYEKEVGIKKQFIESSSKVVTLIIPQKFNVVTKYKVCNTKDITTIITDDSVDNEKIKEYKKMGIECI